MNRAEVVCKQWSLNLKSYIIKQNIIYTPFPQESIPLVITFTPFPSLPSQKGSEAGNVPDDTSTDCLVHCHNRHLVSNVFRLHAHSGSCFYCNNHYDCGIDYHFGKSSNCYWC